MLVRNALTIVPFLVASIAAAPSRADVVTRLPTNDKVVALTFDACEAGQRMAFDHGILDYLLAHKIRFTVFASGKFVRDNAPEMVELAKLDFVDIENHSWNHPNNMDQLTPAAVIDQVRRTEEEIQTVTGRKAQFFRFPAGNYNEEGLKAVENQGYKVVHWRWATGDPDPHEGANSLYHRVITKTEPGDILIFHINGRGVHTAEALPRIVEQLQAEGYHFALVSDYLGHPPAAIVPATPVVVNKGNAVVAHAPQETPSPATN